MEIYMKEVLIKNYWHFFDKIYMFDGFWGQYFSYLVGKYRPKAQERNISCRLKL